MMPIQEDLDYLAARVHARYGQAADAARLDALCRLRSAEALSRAVLPEAAPSGAVELQRGVALAWLREMQELACGLGRARARMIEAFSSRLGVEDLKVLVRGLSADVPAAALEEHLLRPAAAPVRASLDDLAAALPASPQGEAASGARADALARLPRPFVLETALDRRYHQGLLAALAGLDRVDRAGVRALVHQEVDHFHLALVARGRFLYGLEPAALLPWHVEGAGIGPGPFATMLSAPDLATAAAPAVGHALDALPPPEELDPATLDALAWRRFLRLARRTFREGAMGFAAVAGYAALRRVEVMNLVTVSEGIRLGVAGDALRARLVPRAAPEVGRA